MMKQPASLAIKTPAGLMLSLITFSAQAELYDDGLMAYTSGNFAKAGQHFMAAAEQGSPGAEHRLIHLFLVWKV